MAGAINQFIAVTTLSPADQIAIGSASLGDDARAALSTLVTFLQGQLTSTADSTQYASPATGATVTISPPAAGGNVFLRLSPSGTLATLTITLPSGPVDKQYIRVFSTQIITALTVNGGTINGAPTTMAAANGTFWLRFDGVSSNWDRVG
jgi:hypothetical protein